MAFEPQELEIIGTLEQELTPAADWPADSPLSFVRRLPPASRGRFGARVISALAEVAGVPAEPSGSDDFTLRITRPNGPVRVAVKFSTEDPPRFQQVRNPHHADGYKYDWLVCVSGRPTELMYWAIPAAVVDQLIHDEHIRIQHQDSETHWFFPSRTADDPFSGQRLSMEGLLAWIR